ncbi:MAG: ComF family protein [Fuerstiella sp.]
MNSMTVHAVADLRRWVRAGIDLAFPPICVFCGENVPVIDCEQSSGFRSTSESAVVCDGCNDSLTPESAAHCQRCGAVVGPHVSTGKGCIHCRTKPIRFDSLICLGMYNDALRNAILSAKWSFSSVTVETLAALLWQHRQEELIDSAADLIIPIPQSHRKRLTRTFNAASLIATVLSRRLGIPADEHILRRRRATRPQKRVSVRQRYANQRDSFRTRDTHLVAGKRILLVDDVLTTGATCSEAARVLKAHKAKLCRAVVLARVLSAT